MALDPTLAWGSAIVYWMNNNGHDNTGCYSCHQWAQLKDFAGTIEVINGGWGNGEAPLTNGDPSRQQDRIDGFLEVCALLGLDPVADGWNGVDAGDPCPCERYFSDPSTCTTPFPAGVCTAATIALDAKAILTPPCMFH